MDPRLKEAWIALSAVNLLFFRRWAEVLPGGHDYFLETARSPATYISLILIVLVSSALAYGALIGARRSGRAWLQTAVRLAFVVVLVVGLIGIIAEGWVYLGRPEVGWWLYVLLGAAGLAGVVYLQRRHRGWHRAVVPVAVSFALVVSPLVPIMFAQGLYHGMAPEAVTARFQPPLAELTARDEDSGRMVIVLFDELDQRLVFEDRPPDLSLPSFDALRNESLYATHAYAPNAATLRSVPSMTTGRFVADALPYSIDGNKLRFRGSESTVEWGETETLFHAARAEGHDVGIAGTYHPYCRIFDEVVSRCSFESHYMPEPEGLDGVVVDHFVQWSQKLPLPDLDLRLKARLGLGDPIGEGRQHREISKAQGLTAAALDMAADPDLDLVFLHINAPHPTGLRGDGRGFFDATTGTFTTGAHVDYFDNLALADHILGQIRAAMEEADLWDDTSLLVTSDHGYRADIWHDDPLDDPEAPPLQQRTDHRVVFLLKPAGGGETLRYDDPFNLIALPGLTAALLADETLATPALAAWLDENGTVGPAPFYKVR